MTSSASRTTRVAAAAALALGLLAGCGLPGGGRGPGATTLAVSIDWGGAPDRVRGPAGGTYGYSSCSDDGTVMVTNTGSNPTLGNVLVTARGTTFDGLILDTTTVASITSSACSVVLQPSQSCTAQIHAE